MKRERKSDPPDLEGTEVYSLKTNPATIISNSFISLLLSLVSLFSFQNVIKQIQLFSLAEAVTIPSNPQLSFPWCKIDLRGENEAQEKDKSVRQEVATGK